MTIAALKKMLHGKEEGANVFPQQLKFNVISLFFLSLAWKVSSWSLSEEEEEGDHAQQCPSTMAPSTVS